MIYLIIVLNGFNISKIDKSENRTVISDTERIEHRKIYDNLLSLITTNSNDGAVMKNVLDISNIFADGGVYLKDISDNLPTLSHLADISNNFADGGVF